jgi:hypothetical protein
MAADPTTMTNPKRIRILMNNAEERGETGLARLCLRRLFELGGSDYSDPVEKRLWQAVSALEEQHRIKHGRAQAAGHTRRKIKNKGAVVTLTDWALAKDVTPGFTALVESGMAEFTGEYIVLEFPDRFDEKAIAAAKARLQAFGVALPQ